MRRFTGNITHTAADESRGLFYRCTIKYVCHIDESTLDCDTGRPEPSIDYGVSDVTSVFCSKSGSTLVPLSTTEHLVASYAEKLLVDQREDIERKILDYVRRHERALKDENTGTQ